VSDGRSESEWEPPQAKRRQVFLALGVIAFALLVLFQTMQIPVSPIYSRVGPTVFPYLVAGGLFVLGVILLVQALRDQWGATDADEDEAQPDWRALGWLGLGLILNVALIDFLGFVIASTLLFCCVARAFGSRQYLRDAAIAIVLCVITYIGFAHGLGISIGAGILEGIL
jgi:putative tricarboxylic transport membrane protein